MPGNDRLARELLNAISKNAHELLEDAQLLLDHERWARAFALATFAAEEIGKGWIFHQQYHFEGRKAFKVSTNHRAKLEAARQMLALYESVSESNVIDAEKWFSEEHNFRADNDFMTRMTHLYVEVVDNRVVGGSDGVGREDAQMAVGFANAVVHLGIQMLGPSEGPEAGDHDLPF
jgi:AbiV family abortive infection protein